MEDVTERVRRHGLWLKGDTVREKPAFSNENLNKVILPKADLRLANFKGCFLKKANMHKAKLKEANFEGADLNGVNLRDADLVGANFLGANLKNADLRGADLRGANLKGADLRMAQLEGCNLSKAILHNTIGDGIYVKSLFFSDVYPVTYTAETVQVGCIAFPAKFWLSATEDQVRAIDGDKAVEYWAQWKDFIAEFVINYPAKPTKE